jgi:hypothetical protein
MNTIHLSESQVNTMRARSNTDADADHPHPNLHVALNLVGKPASIRLYLFNYPYPQVKSMV